MIMCYKQLYLIFKIQGRILEILLTALLDIINFSLQFLIQYISMPGSVTQMTQICNPDDPIQLQR